MFAHHYIAVAIAALSGFIFLRLVAGNARVAGNAQYDKSELQGIWVRNILFLGGVEAFMTLTPFLLSFAGNDVIFKSFFDFDGARYHSDSGYPAFSVLMFCGFVSSDFVVFRNNLITENDKFYDLLISLCVFVQLNFVTVPLLTFAITIKHFTSAFLVCIFIIFGALCLYRFTNRSSIKTSK